MDRAVIVGRAAMQRELQQNVLLRRSNNWQDECAGISADKARRRRRISRKRKIFLASAVLVPAYLAAGGWWLAHSDLPQQWRDTALGWAAEQATHAGFTLKSVRIEGMQALTAEDVMQAAQLELLMPMFSLSLPQMRERIQQLPQVREVKIRRQFPDTLAITLTERQRAALWMQGGKVRWLDKDGTVLTAGEALYDMGDHPALKIMGEDAPAHLPALLEMLSTHPQLAEKITSARRVGGRRWDLVLRPGLLVKLPQENASQAWDRLATLYKEQKLDKRSVRMIDLRIEDRVFVRPKETSPEMEPANRTAPPATDMGGSHDA